MCLPDFLGVYMDYKWEWLCQCRGAQICLEIGLKNKFSYWFALVSGADPDKEYGGAIIIWANKVLISEQNHFWFAGGLWENYAVQWN